MEKVNQDVENVKDEITKLQGAVDELREIIESNKEEASSAKAELEQLENDLSSLKEEALEISDLNHFNKQKLIKINSDLSVTNEIFKVEEKTEKKVMDGSSIMLCFIGIPAVVFIVSMGLIFGIDKLPINEILKMLSWTMIVIALWLLSFWIMKKLLIRKRIIVMKKTYDQFYAIVVCFAFLIAVGILIQEPSRSVMDNQTFLSIVSIPFAVMPSILIKPFLLNEKEIFIEDDD